MVKKGIIENFPKAYYDRAFAVLERMRHVSFSGANGVAPKAFLVSDYLRTHKSTGNLFWVVNDKAEMDLVNQEIETWSGVSCYTFYDKLLEEGDGSLSEGEKKLNVIEFLEKLSRPEKKVMVVPYRSLLMDFPDFNKLKERILTIKEADKIESLHFFDQLISLGYEVSGDDYPDKGTYYKKGGVFTIFPINSDFPYRFEINFDKIEDIVTFDPTTGEIIEKHKTFSIFPAYYEEANEGFESLLTKNDCLWEGEIDVIDDYLEDWDILMEKCGKIDPHTVTFLSFNEDNLSHEHLHFVSVLKYRTSYDFINDLNDKFRTDWKVVLFTKNRNDIVGLLKVKRMPFLYDIEEFAKQDKGLFLVDVDKEGVFPHAFNNPEIKLLVISDKDISLVRDEKVKKVSSHQKVYFDFLTGLKMGDFVVHADHGIARFFGLEKKTVDSITREYLKLGYAENDKLFVPIDQADKVSKYIGSEESMPKLTRLGSAEWETITSKVKKETQKIAKELLKLYAERKAAKGVVFKSDTDLQDEFEKGFVYEETPGQLKAIYDVKKDMESPQPMDRLVCGDVGFGKTEVAMRAAFKAVQNKKQVAVLSPITILADQHYKSFKKRMEPFNIRVDVLSRFKTKAEQKEIVERLKKGEVDVIVGTHRLLQADIQFKDLGLVVVDEEQRFGVKQKEVLKALRSSVDILTLTATPIPRTLNICLNKLRDITTITTPPPGRLPIITEVRKYSSDLIRDAILREVARGGQIYFLHNRVQTIDAMAHKLRLLVPEARFGVAHGKLGAGDLEERIMAFQEHKFDVLVSSTIVENGIDLPNANTLIVNNAERFGLSQLYQLRGRVGRGKTQAYAYFLYHGQRLKIDAKKRLRAIVEASELGSGFQIAMKDLEIRGAGDILGSNQHGVINVVGVTHFVRMLNKAVEDLKAGKFEEDDAVQDVSIELPIPSFIPDTYIVNSKDKINTYQKLSSADSFEYLAEIEEELIEDYGKLPDEVLNLFKLLQIKLLAKEAGLINVRAENMHLNRGRKIVLHMSGKVKPENIMNLLNFNGKWQISGTKLLIDVADLGMHWVDVLRENIKRLSGSIRDKKKKE